MTEKYKSVCHILWTNLSSLSISRSYNSDDDCSLQRVWLGWIVTSKLLESSFLKQFPVELDSNAEFSD